MTVVVYVAGPSDRDALDALLRPLTERKRQEGVAIEFHPAARGDRKIWVLTQAPERAVNILRNNPDAVVVALPDLFPPNKGFPHVTAKELIAGVRANFDANVKRKVGDAQPGVRGRFRVFCLKHDLEALLLAAEEPLRRRLGTERLKLAWRNPVEDQNQNHPPRQVVEDLFRAHQRRYQSTVDAPAILKEADYNAIADRCPQCFKPFVEFLESLP